MLLKKMKNKPQRQNILNLETNLVIKNTLKEWKTDNNKP